MCQAGGPESYYSRARPQWGLTAEVTSVGTRVLVLRPNPDSVLGGTGEPLLRGLRRLDSSHCPLLLEADFRLRLALAGGILPLSSWSCFPKCVGGL